MESRLFSTLEYDKVLKQLLPFAASRLGKEKIEQLRPASDLVVAQDALKATAEGADVLRLKGGAPFGGIRDLRPALKRAKIGATLSIGQLLDVAGTVASGRRLKRFLERASEEETLKIPILAARAAQITGLKELEQAILRVIDENGDVRDGASSELRRIRMGVRQTERDIKAKLEQIVKGSRFQKMLQEAIVTVRNDRYVIPVKQEYRAHFGGVVHDESASGATVFVEPEAIVALNHRLNEWQLKEEREIERLLAELSAEVALHVDALQDNLTAIAELEFIFAKAGYARHIEATMPRLNDRGVIELKAARHPLIAREHVVPIDVILGAEYSTLVVTGPNTGGKTVTLKTIGLHVLMAMSGLFIPAQEESEVAVFENVFADIGDEQSIEQNLSTFSGHMTNIIRILSQLSANSLVLLDELGAGTDPSEGAALAIALLDDIHRRGCRVVATTHYNELKAYAYSRDNVMNASVEFDVETLSPTYRLLIGVPGRSNAFLIAQRLGLSAEIIEIAKTHLSTEENRVEDMIASLEANRKAAERERETTARLRREVERLRAAADQEREQLEREKTALRRRAEEDARDIVAKAKREAETIIEELRKMQASQTTVKEHRLIELKKRLDEQDYAPHVWKGTTGVHSEGEAKQPQRTMRIADVPVGDEVFVQSFNQKGVVVEKMNDKEWQVQVGMMKVNVPVSSLEPIPTKRTSEAPVQAPATTVKRAKTDVGLSLDLRGQTIDEAVLEVDKYLDDAVLAGLKQVSIIHGKGTGALRAGIHQFLRRHRSVNGFRLGGQGEGGSGATVVELK